MITIEQYAGVWATSADWTPERKANGWKLLLVVNTLMTEMESQGIQFRINPKTGSQVSGETFGGFRPQSCPIGAPHSNHKEGLAVDIFDHTGEIDKWCMAHQYRLAFHGIYIEHPDSTPGWCHMQNIAPHSGHTVFYP